MREYRIFYIALTIMAFIMCFVYQGKMMLMIFLLMLIFPLVSLIFLIISFFTLKIDLNTRDLLVKKDQSGELEIKIKNNFLLGLSTVNLVGTFQSDFSYKTAKSRIITSVPPFSSIKINIPYKFPYRGEYEISADYAEVFDLLKLFKLKKKINKTSHMMVIPREINYPIDESLSRSDSSKTSPISNNKERELFTSLREYRDGDNIRTIHWKLSAKQDNLIVKQYEQTFSNSPLILLDFTTKMQSEELFLKATDIVIEVALAISKHTLLDGGDANVCWHDEKTSRVERLSVHDDETYRTLFYALTMVSKKQADKEFSTIIDYCSREIGIDSVAGADRSVYIISPSIDESLLETLSKVNKTLLKNVLLISFSDFLTDKKVIDYIENETDLKLTLLDIKSDI